MTLFDHAHAEQASCSDSFVPPQATRIRFVRQWQTTQQRREGRRHRLVKRSLQQEAQTDSPKSQVQQKAKERHLGLELAEQVSVAAQQRLAVADSSYQQLLRVRLLRCPAQSHHELPCQLLRLQPSILWMIHLMSIFPLLKLFEALMIFQTFYLKIPITPETHLTS